MTRKQWILSVNCHIKCTNVTPKHVPEEAQMTLDSSMNVWTCQSNYMNNKRFKSIINLKKHLCNCIVQIEPSNINFLNAWESNGFILRQVLAPVTKNCPIFLFPAPFLPFCLLPSTICWLHDIHLSTYQRSNCIASIAPCNPCSKVYDF